MSLFCRMCKSGTDDQILNGTEQNCDYFVDNLFEEAQKVGAICMAPTTIKNQVGSEEKILMFNVITLQEYSGKQMQEVQQSYPVHL